MTCARVLGHSRGSHRIFTHFIYFPCRFSSYFLPYSSPLHCPLPFLTDWVQNLPAAKFEWGRLEDWNVTNVTDFSFAFSTCRDKVGGTYVSDGNPKAASFDGAGLDSWDTSSLTTLHRTFTGASSMNADLGNWSISKVITLTGTFDKATLFTGSGIDLWITSSVIKMRDTFKEAGVMDAHLGGWDVAKVATLYHTFYGARAFRGRGLDSWRTSAVTGMSATFAYAGEMNAELSKWSVDNVTTLERTFRSASKFTGKGLSSWITTSVTDLSSTFLNAGKMDADLSGWSVAKVTTMYNAFNGASKFAGTGLSSWITTSITSLSFTFDGAGEMNADLSKWSVAKVTTMVNTFYKATKMNADLSAWKVGTVTTLFATFRNAAKFTGAGLDSWDILKVKNMALTFSGATAIPACTKNAIADAWKSNLVFNGTTYATSWVNKSWVNKTCPAFTPSPPSPPSAPSPSSSTTLSPETLPPSPRTPSPFSHPPRTATPPCTCGVPRPGGADQQCSTCSPPVIILRPPLTPLGPGGSSGGPGISAPPSTVTVVFTVPLPPLSNTTLGNMTYVQYDEV